MIAKRNHYNIIFPNNENNRINKCLCIAWNRFILFQWQRFDSLTGISVNFLT